MVFSDCRCPGSIANFLRIYLEGAIPFLLVSGALDPAPVHTMVKRKIGECRENNYIVSVGNDHGIALDIRDYII